MGRGFRIRRFILLTSGFRIEHHARLAGCLEHFQPRPKLGLEPHGATTPGAVRIPGDLEMDASQTINPFRIVGGMTIHASIEPFSGRDEKWAGL